MLFDNPTDEESDSEAGSVEHRTAAHGAMQLADNAFVLDTGLSERLP